MPPTMPFHSTRPDEDVFHNNAACTEGNNVEDHYKAWGPGTGLRLCDHCAALNEEGR